MRKAEKEEKQTSFDLWSFQGQNSPAKNENPLKARGLQNCRLSKKKKEKQISEAEGRRMKGEEGQC
jgi:hypothetical protein